MLPCAELRGGPGLGKDFKGQARGRQAASLPPVPMAS